MNYSILFTVIAAAALGLSACGKSEEPAEEAAAPVTGAAEEAKSDAEKALAEAKEKGREAAEAASEAAAQVAKSARERGGEIAETAKEAGTEMADAANARAEAFIAQVKEYLANNDTDLAAETMEKLRAIKASLSETAQAQIEQLEQMLAATKGGAAPPPQGQ
jgi:outer membrane protein OmpA-like peptidoglycan-associated protein